MKKIAFTGHRLPKLPYQDETDPRCAKLKQRLFCEAQRHLQPDQTIYLSGMASGVDLWAAEAVILLKNAFPARDIQLWAVVPYRNQAASWPKALRDCYQDLLAEQHGSCYRQFQDGYAIPAHKGTAYRRESGLLSRNPSREECLI